MAKRFNSFYKSPMGAFVKSPLGVRGVLGCETTFTCPHCAAGKIGKPVTLTATGITYAFDNSAFASTCYDCDTGPSHRILIGASPVLTLNGTFTGQFASLDTTTSGNVTSQSCYAQFNPGSAYNYTSLRYALAACNIAGGSFGFGGTRFLIMRTATGYRVMAGADAKMIAFYGEVLSTSCRKGVTLTVNNVFTAEDVGCHTEAMDVYPHSAAIVAAALRPEYAVIGYGGSITFTVCP